MMRFLVVLGLIGAACAQYNYNPSSGGRFDGSSTNVSPSYLAPGSGAAASNNQPSFSSPNGAESYNSPAGAESYNSPAGAESYNSPSYSSPAGYDKEYYTFTGEDDDDYDPAASDQVNSSLKKNLRVIFIKSPENRGLENAALGLARQAAEQKTAIYVLNKQADIGDLANKVNAIRNNNNNRPEVHFVKYRTPQDAANAQHAIQSQYDQLGGSSQSYNGGIAPSINYASRSPVIPANHGSYGAASAPSSSYLPANILRRLRLRT
ncbi:uncharacterized protein LOC115620365 [Scaptodrosophila lebanonensis]|uniref:Uncharacterized protein LOC115620365 n=1 Tax=Drosophila lebanonensis TaxID=7225 RepID=A0A6J2T2G8_DROLE|nr:uncharacterized protein LOC115620365 [Scaptodrosophila lebanonensis]